MSDLSEFPTFVSNRAAWSGQMFRSIESTRRVSAGRGTWPRLPKII